MGLNRGHWRGICLGALLWMMLVVHVVAAPPLQGDQTVHVVQVGETLFAIAQQYGVTVEAIVAANGLADPNWIEVGQHLVIPGAEASTSSAVVVYVVQAGDTLALIARRHNVSVEEVARSNYLTNPNLIYVGQKLVIPVAGQGAGAAAGGRVYVVQAGDTMAQISARYGTTVWTVAQANGISNPNVLYVGQRLLIPVGGEDTSNLPSPFVAVHILPPVTAQGRTVQVVVETEGEVALGGSYNGAPLFFIGGGGEYRTLIGIHAMAKPGPYPLDLKAVQGERTVSVRSMVQVVEGDFGVQYLTFSSEKAQLLDPDLVAREAQRLWEITTQATLPGMWQGKFGAPLAGNPPITAPFGIRRSYQGGPPVSYHSGVDYDPGEGTPVSCPARGRVVLAEALDVRGNAVIIDHGRGVMSGYWHLSQIDVVVGQAIEVGDLLGRVGNTGLSTGAHLQWEVRVMGIHVDPWQWIQEYIQ